jgi:hypothetical protein
MTRFFIIYNPSQCDPPPNFTIFTFIRIGGYDFNYLSKTFKNKINLKLYLKFIKKYKAINLIKIRMPRENINFLTVVLKIEESKRQISCKNS